MSTKFTGRQFNVGIGKESSRGTAVSPSYWLQWDTLTIDDEIDVVKQESTVGTIEKGIGQEVANFESKGSVGGNITDLAIGLLLKSIMGTDTVGAVETGVKDHVFTVLQSAQHPVLTFGVVEPNSNSGSGFSYPLCTIDSLELNFEVNKYSTYKATFMGNKGATSSISTSYVAENRFRPQDGTIGIAANLTGLASPTTLLIQKASITIKQNSEKDIVIGNTAPVDRLNKEFTAEGTMELKYTDRTLIDTYMLGDAYAAVSFAFVNSGVLIGAASHPTITIRLAKIKMESIARKIDQKGIITQSVKFTGFYSISDTEMLDITVRNTVTSAY